MGTEDPTNNTARLYQLEIQVLLCVVRKIYNLARKRWALFKSVTRGAEKETAMLYSYIITLSFIL